MKKLITGAAGYTGPVAAPLLKMGGEVTSIDNFMYNKSKYDYNIDNWHKYDGYR